MCKSIIQIFLRHKPITGTRCRGKEYHAWDQFRDSDGKPILSATSDAAGTTIYPGASGVLPKGKFKGKIILLESLLGQRSLSLAGGLVPLPSKAKFGRQSVTIIFGFGSLIMQSWRYLNSDDPTRTVSYLGVFGTGTS